MYSKSNFSSPVLLGCVSLQLSHQLLRDGGEKRQRDEGGQRQIKEKEAEEVVVVGVYGETNGGENACEGE